MDVVVLGVDIGTTGVKAVAFDGAGRAHGHAAHRYPLDHPAPDHAVQDPEAVVSATLAAIRDALDRAPPPAGLALSSAMHSLVGLDRAGRPLTPLLTWADARATAQAERLQAGHPELHARTGTPVHPMAPLCKLAWFAEHEPDLCRRVARWVGIKELVMARLTGEWLIDVSCASATGLLGLDTLAWDQPALALAGVETAQLSRVVGVKEAYPARADVPGLGAGTPVVVGAGDGPLANLGLGAVRPGVAACSIGTSGALRVMVERPGIDPARRVFCFALTPGRWVVGGAINNGGSVLGWAGEALAPELGAGAEEELLGLAAAVPAGSDALLMLPYLLGERAPLWSPLPRGAYVGLTQAHGRGHLVRAALEGVCLQLALVLASVRAAGNEVREVRATGGFARSPLWRQMLTDALGMPVGFARGYEGSAFGAALLGMEALGLIGSIDRAAELVTIEEMREPHPDAAAVYAELLPLFARLTADLGPAFSALRALRA